MNSEQTNIYMILWDLWNNGELSSPRGMLVKECENFNYELGPYERFCNFESRKLNLNYIKKEFLWYLKGERFDTSITEQASMWKNLVNGDGSINSNYGQYIFSSGNFGRVFQELKKDKDSRRGSIIILNNNHLNSETNDVPCTYSINFRIRINKLNMTVRMRSQDCCFGMGNDLPCFSFIHEMMYVVLKDIYSELEYGNYYHSADSFHVYERHFGMMDKIVNEQDVFNKIECPKISSSEEVWRLITPNGEEIPETFEFTRWLNQ